MTRTVIVGILALAAIAALGVARAQQTVPSLAGGVPASGAQLQAAPQAADLEMHRVLAALQAQRNAAMDAHAFAEARVGTLQDKVQQLTVEVHKLRAELATRRN